MLYCRIGKRPPYFEFYLLVLLTVHADLPTCSANHLLVFLAQQVQLFSCLTWFFCKLVENKIKEVKRIMFGRANLELLKRKLILEPLLFN